MRRRLQFLHLMARAMGVNYRYHVRILRPGLKRADTRGMGVGVADSPAEAIALLQESITSAKVKGHHFIQVEARPLAFHVNPRQREAPARERRGIHEKAPAHAEPGRLFPDRD